MWEAKLVTRWGRGRASGVGHAALVWGVVKEVGGGEEGEGVVGVECDGWVGGYLAGGEAGEGLDFGDSAGAVGGSGEVDDGVEG